MHRGFVLSSTGSENSSLGSSPTIEISSVFSLSADRRIRSGSLTKKFVCKQSCQLWF